MTRIILCAVLLATSGCTRYVIKEKPVLQYVEKRVECPSQEERDRLRDARPKRLREQAMPTDPVERNGRNMTQLGRYEGEGGYADQVDAALDRCQQQ